MKDEEDSFCFDDRYMSLEYDEEADHTFEESAVTFQMRQTSAETSDNETF